ncbi:hypothetical protein M0R72_21985 [Candidatus Pacearchaeota archaeon]|jgi:hypothetical protein|nr:hypothetical protein [Candidatus Pacearchaeota archaeon]
MDLSQVPLLVLEKVRNKWERILEPNHDMYNVPCAMCEWWLVDDGWECNGCPIMDECAEILDSSPGWNERRERFLLHVRAEIERRAEEACA